MNEIEKKMFSKNLVVLQYESPNVSTAIPLGLSIDIEKEEWQFKNPKDISPFQPTPRKIGHFNYSMKCCSHGVIGVYDKSNIIHLNSMVKDWKEIHDQDREP